ncbi:MAG: hypothetical protein ACI9YT_001562 [Halobacteriales archaeon]|jgi:hypothetical protein
MEVGGCRQATGWQRRLQAVVSNPGNKDLVISYQLLFEAVASARPVFRVQLDSRRRLREGRQEPFSHEAMPPSARFVPISVEDGP